MKLITDQVDSKLEYLTEEVGEDSTPQLFIEGIFMQADIRNKNRRVYPKGVLETAVNTYINDFVLRDRSLGELNHPEAPRVNLDKVSHKITNLRWDGDNVIGKAVILESMPLGKIAANLMREGIQLAVSSRGVGKINKKTGIMERFIMTAEDIVHDPSAPETFVNGVMEGVEYFVDEEGQILQEQVKDFVESTPKYRIDQAAVFATFLESIKA